MNKSLLLILCLTLASAASETEKTQIFLWTPIVLALIAVYAVYYLAYMDNGRDSILYAKIILDTDAQRA